jgi:hypothetical protein
MLGYSCLAASVLAFCFVSRDLGDGVHQPKGNDSSIALSSAVLFAAQKCGTSEFHTIPANTQISGVGTSTWQARLDAIAMASGVTCEEEVCFGLDCLLNAEWVGGTLHHELSTEIEPGVWSYSAVTGAGGIDIWTHCDC